MPDKPVDLKSRAARMVWGEGDVVPVPGEEIELTPEEDAALDRAAERVAKEEAKK